MRAALAIASTGSPAQDETIAAAVSPPPTPGLVAGWVRFWFTAVDPVGLHTLRVLSGMLFLLWLLPLAGQVEAFFGLAGWYDAKAYAETARLPVLPPHLFSWSLPYLSGTNVVALRAVYWGSTAAVALFLALTQPGCRKADRGERSGDGGKVSIQSKGSDTMLNLGIAWSEEYRKVAPNVDVAVAGGGSGQGIAALSKGTIDVANCSRNMKPEEIETTRKNTPPFRRVDRPPRLGWSEPRMCAQRVHHHARVTDLTRCDR